MNGTRGNDMDPRRWLQGGWHGCATWWKDSSVGDIHGRQVYPPRRGSCLVSEEKQRGTNRRSTPSSTTGVVTLRAARAMLNFICFVGSEEFMRVKKVRPGCYARE